MNSSYLLEQIMSYVFFGVEMPNNREFWIGLGVSDSESDNEPIEIEAGYTGYNRKLLGRVGDFLSPTQASVTNKYAVLFDEALSDWNGISHWMVFDAETDGNLLMFGDFAETFNVVTGTAVYFRPQDLVFEVV